MNPASKAWRQRGAHNQGELSDYTEKEREIMADIELRKLQQQFRIMMENRKSFGFKTEQLLHQQEKQIHVLKQENEEINLIQSLILSPQNLFMDEQNCLTLKFLLHAKDKCNDCIRATKALLAELDSKVLQLEGKIKKQKILVIRMRQEYEGKRLQKRIYLLDNRLHQLTVHFDILLTINAKLREDIDNLQIQKSVFDGIYWRLYRQLDQQRKTIDFSIERSMLAYEQRTEALARISAMKERRAKDLASFNIEFRDLERIYNHETKLRAFMFMKMVDRSEFEEQAKKEEALKARKRAKTKGETLQNYEKAYQRLLDLTEDGDIDQLVDDFIDKEEKNFALFSYITELINENDRLQKIIEDTQNETNRLIAKQKKDEDEAHNKLKELEEQLQKTTEGANWAELKLKESRKILDQLKSLVDLLFRELDCDATKIKEHLGESGDITDQNLLAHLSIIEKKSNNLLLIESFLHYKDVEGELDSVPMLNPFLGGSAALKKVEPIKIAPPTLSVDPFADYTEPSVEAPLDYQKLRALVLENQEKLKTRVDSGERTDSPGREKKKPSST
ncbi:coiled-coil domain-containing protein 63 [Sceloporus undulatus]|uniref:coiled-coil domain-containing protein 63 n=1 Tax=Sceloporus undulatus TaxID=8520 RepID=UPI001C4B2B2B|nr:coiled-coil domain-containing protein 63 [Sceloporus undulatus]XP_042336629.1 coiled-coil domain-containing protein 63 [Sceloporus undulatus]